jgi:elongation factor P hydroxylase
MTLQSEYEDTTVNQLIGLFNRLFKPSYHTILVRGQEEPIYLPHSENFPYNQIVFAHGSFSSALHEISHWCLAGKKRRTLVDYGYWYVPNRESSMQIEFFNAEIKPQALELLFTLACGRRFFLSADNLKDGGSEATAEVVAFKNAVIQKALQFLSRLEIPPRAQLFLSHLFAEFNPNSSQYEAEDDWDHKWMAHVRENLFKLEKTLDF